MIHHLLVPGLLDAPPAGVDVRVLPHFPVLERMLCRAWREAAAESLDACLLRIFQIEEDPARVAALSWLGQRGEAHAGPVVRATPVHFHADRDQLLVFQLGEDDLNMEEARGFCELFNVHFKDDGLHLNMISPLEWYLLLAEELRVDFTPLSTAAGHSVGDFLPSGEASGYWRRLINETQMLFFQSSLNERRASKGQVPVSGLWFSGGGSLPEPGGIAPGRVNGSSSLMAGLQQLATRVAPDSELFLFTDIEKSLVEQDAQAWQRGVEALEQRLALLKREEVYLYTCRGITYHWKPSMQYHFWRRPRGLTMLIPPTEEPS